MPRLRFSQRLVGVENGQTYHDRTCEVVFAGLDTAVDVDKVQTFAMRTKLLVKDYERMLAGINSVLTGSLGKFGSLLFSS